jgi:hypothetical protein
MWYCTVVPKYRTNLKIMWTSLWEKSSRLQTYRWPLTILSLTNVDKSSSWAMVTLPEIYYGTEIRKCKQPSASGAKLRLQVRSCSQTSSNKTSEIFYNLSHSKNRSNTKFIDFSMELRFNLSFLSTTIFFLSLDKRYIRSCHEKG